MIEDIQAYRPLVWYNPNIRPYAEARADIPLSADDIEAARRRMHRWEPVLARLFPESFRFDEQTADDRYGAAGDNAGAAGGNAGAAGGNAGAAGSNAGAAGSNFEAADSTGGRIESPLVDLRRIPEILFERYRLKHRSDTRGASPPPRILLKLDSHLAVSGSIKARGGFHEVLALTERILGIDTARDISALDTAGGFIPEGSSIAVGSTGNLGLSIGILGAALGFGVTVHMSADARRWKKDLLRSRGVTVIEHQGDFGAAVAAGRATAEGDPRCHFVDDERSRDLFLGYAAAAKPLRRQLQKLGVRVDEEHPLYVYLPCGVGGGPGGVTFGLKEEFGDHVQCFFVEPTHAPAMLAGMVTGLHDRISVQDLGLDNRTVADGLAVGRPSGLVGPAMHRVLSGVMTLPDEEMLAMVALLAEHEGYRLEPSAVAGLPAPYRIAADRGTPLARGTHLVWATGGSMVPREEMEQWIEAGRAEAGRAEADGPDTNRPGTDRSDTN